ncbi:MAG: hypothetical protein K0S08_1969 [Gammaproteobacteria bacterium]|nr:hypothetical protein [Gammaproteobacteria bacterium]
MTRGKNQIHARHKPAVLASQRRQEQYITEKLSPSADDWLNISAEAPSPIFWQRLLVKWHRLSFQAKTTYVLVALVGSGLTIMAAYYLLPTILESLHHRANEIAKTKPICQGFTTVRGDPHSAQVVFLGEIHTEKSLTTNCLNVLAIPHKDRVTVLVEAAPIGFEVSCKDFHVPKHPNIICKGWDDPKSLAQSHLETRTEIYNLFLETVAKIFYNRHYTPEEMDIFVQGLFDKFQKELKKFGEYTHREADDLRQTDYSLAELEFLTFKVHILLCQDLQELRKQGSSYSDIFEQLRKPPSLHTAKYGPQWIQDTKGQVVFDWMIYAQDDQDLIASVETRQASLIQAVRAEREANTQRLLVQAGMFHVFFPPKASADTPVTEVLKRTVTLLEDVCPETSCATLVSNTLLGRILPK